MKEQKNAELNFLYEEVIDEEEKKKTKNKKAGKEPASKKKSKKKKQDTKQEDERFSFDNEIVIGVTRLPEEKKKNNKTNNSKKAPKKKIKSKTNNKKKKEAKIIDEKKYKRRKRILFFIKWTSIITIIIGIIIAILLSPLFNIQQIKIENNEKISSQTIKELSTIREGQNLFSLNKYNIINKLKTNPYIENVEIKRNLPSGITIKITERKATYILKVEEQYACMNNQGYILEMLGANPGLPEITSFETETEDIKPGGRLKNEDLIKMGNVLKIMEAAKNNEIETLITQIDIKDDENYKLTLEGESKIVYLGDITDINTRILYLKVAVEDNKGIAGEIYINKDLRQGTRFVEAI